jgi:hypothetical protein
VRSLASPVGPELMMAQSVPTSTVSAQSEMGETPPNRRE